MTNSNLVGTRSLETARAFAEAYARGEAASVAHLLHPDVREQGVVAGGYEIDTSGRDAFIAEISAFLAPYEPPEILCNSVEPVGSLHRWSTRWRMRKGDETSLFEWHALLTVENGLITRIDKVCTGKLPEPRWTAL